MQQALEAQVVDKTETEHLLYGFLDMRAKTDDSLTVEQSETIVATVANENREGGVSNVEIAAIVGRRLAAVGTYNRQPGLLIKFIYFLLSIQLMRLTQNTIAS